MIRKFVVKFMTKFALKRNKTERDSESYANAKRIGLVYSYVNDGQHHQVDGLRQKLVADGKSVETLVFTPRALKLDDFHEPCFTELDYSSKGKWKKDHVVAFKTTAFDYLICLDEEINKYIRNILASSKAKCRVGGYAEGNEAFFEFMINQRDMTYAQYLEQLYHYITQLKNG